MSLRMLFPHPVREGRLDCERQVAGKGAAFDIHHTRSTRNAAQAAP